MSRIKLEPLGVYPFSSHLQVRVTEINYGGHLANNAVAGLLHQARIEVLEELGFSELDLGDGATGLIMTDMVISFGAEAFLNDELVVQSGFGGVKRMTFRMHHRILRDTETVALAELGLAGYDYRQHRPAALPAALLAALR